MARRSDHSREEIREMALAAAERIVGLEGYKGLSARKVASEIGYTVGTLYLIFRNLEELIYQVNGRTLDTLYERMAVVPGNFSTPHACVAALANAYIAFALEQPKRWGMLYEYAVPEGNRLPDWYQAKVVKLFGLVEKALLPLTKQYPQRDVEQAARVLWAGVHGICLLNLTNKLNIAGEDSAQELAEILIHRFLQGFNEVAGRVSEA